MKTTVVQCWRTVAARLDLVQGEHCGAFDGTWRGSGNAREVRSPIDGSPLANVCWATQADYELVAASCSKAFLSWRVTPAPKRGEFIRRLSERFRELKPALSQLVTIETGKTISESEGEVQEVIDICDFAVGLARQLYGVNMPSERMGHRIMEQWHPIGPIGCITAFNFPCAVWAWNFAIGVVCGNIILWKPSELTPLTAIACTKIVATVALEYGIDPCVGALVVGSASMGSRLASDKRFPLISATGSSATGASVALATARRHAKAILELGGNNAAIISRHANIKLAAKAVFFGAIGTAGQRCTSTRRVIVHRAVYTDFLTELTRWYSTVRVGSPLNAGINCGPLISHRAMLAMKLNIKRALAEGGKIAFGGERLKVAEKGAYVTPAVIEMPHQSKSICEEVFAPILYLIRYDTIDEAIAIQNGVRYGLTSAIFSENLAEVEQFIGPQGSDCGIANVNTSTSGAEIGGAFGGEKDSGGGRESGSDAWKGYMRRVTSTINGTDVFRMAQDIEFPASQGSDPDESTKRRSLRKFVR